MLPSLNPGLGSPPSWRGHRLAVAFILPYVLVDLVSKYWAWHLLSDRGLVTLWTNVSLGAPILHTGWAFDSHTETMTWTNILSVSVGAAVAVFYFAELVNEYSGAYGPLAMVTGGGVANGLERLYHFGVTDFIYLQSSAASNVALVTNFADLFIFGGLLMCLTDRD